jgi:parvulin-like peptidyl-prolyl isomerase
LYLRLLDDNADFGSLARSHSLGEERFTHGLVGPMLISQPHATIRAVLEKLTVGEVHPPFRVENWVLLLQMEHRQPASLTDAIRLQLYNELFQKDLEATLDQQLQAIYPTLLPQESPLLPSPVA